MTGARVSARRLTAGLAVTALLLWPAPAAAYERPGELEYVSGGAWDMNHWGVLNAAISADGRFVAFVGGDVLLYDRHEGTTVRVTMGYDGERADRFSNHPSLSADGRYVAFWSDATNLVPGDSNDRADVFVWDRVTGETELVSVASDGTQGNDHSRYPVISADGLYVGLTSWASNLVEGDTNGAADTFVHDRQTGVTERVSVASDGGQAPGGVNGGVYNTTLSADGRYVAFTSYSDGLHPDRVGTHGHVYLHDRDSGETELVSRASDRRPADASALMPSLSADGRYLAFSSDAKTLVPGASNATWNVYVRDLHTGETERVSVDSAGREGRHPSQVSPASHSSNTPRISADGRHVFFQSRVPHDPRKQSASFYDAFVHDRRTGVTERVSGTVDGRDGNQNAFGGGMSADGRYVVFITNASNLEPGAGPGSGSSLPKAFVRDRGPALGIGRLDVQVSGGAALVEGWSTFSGGVVAEAVAVPAEPPGVGVGGGQLVYRHEPEDLLARVRVPGLPPLAAPAGGPSAPGVAYGAEFAVGGVTYRAVVGRGLSATSQGRAALHRCDPDCAKVTDLAGNVGSTGDLALIQIPLAAISAAPGTALTDVRVFSAVGDPELGVVAELEGVSLGDADLPEARVELATAPAGSAPTEAAFQQIDSPEGLLFTTIAAPDGHAVWARACLADDCEVRAP